MTEEYVPQGYEDFSAERLTYDAARDGVWLHDRVFLPRAVVIEVLGLLAEHQPRQKAEREKPHD